MKHRALTILFLGTLCACTTEIITEKPDSPSRLVRVLFSPGGLGDLSYNDGILRGIVKEQQHTEFGLYYLHPQDLDAAEKLVSTWQKYDNGPLNYYTILAGSEYEEIARKYNSDSLRTDYLMFETADTTLSFQTFRFRGYGVSFIIGIAAYTLTQADSAVYLGGWPDDPFIKDCYRGFTDGYIHAGGQKVAACYLAPSSEGFAMPAKAYLMADSLFRIYPFVYLMAGGSNNGVYQYLREHSETIGYTNGVDMDQSAYSDRIIGSMIKNAGECVAASIRAWANNEATQHHKEYDLKSGSIYFKVADKYQETLQGIVADSWDTAVQHEQKFIEQEQ